MWADKPYELDMIDLLADIILTASLLVINIRSLPKQNKGRPKLKVNKTVSTTELFLSIECLSDAFILGEIRI